MNWRISEYRAARGHYPVKDFIDGLQDSLAAKLLYDIDLLREFGLNVGSKYIRKLRGTRVNLWELRTQHGNNHVRVFFGLIGDRRLLLLHGFVKKSRRTPSREIRLAESRLIGFLGAANDSNT